MEQLFKELLANVLENMENVEMIAVIDRDGLPITSLLKKETDEIIGAVTASFDSFLQRAKAEFKGDSFLNIMSLGDRKFMFTSAGDNAILTIVGNEDVSDSALKVYGKWTTGKVMAIFQRTENVSLEVPSIIKVMSKFADGKAPKGEYSAKIIVCGDYKVGKTSLIRRFVDDQFKENYIATIGVDITKKTIELDKQCVVDFIIWDIGGQIQQMAPYRKRFYTGANAAFIVFDITRHETFDHIQRWLDDISKEVGDKIPKIIVGNKNDLIYDMEVETEEIKKLAEDLGLEYIETSAKTSENVHEAFTYMAYKVVR